MGSGGICHYCKKYTCECPRSFADDLVEEARAVNLLPVQASLMREGARVIRQLESTLGERGLTHQEDLGEGRVAFGDEASVARVRELAKQREDMAMLIRRLAYTLSRSVPGHALADQAKDYLRRKGLQGSPLRGGEGSEEVVGDPLSRQDPTAGPILDGAWTSQG